MGYLKSFLDLIFATGGDCAEECCFAGDGFTFGEDETICGAPALYRLESMTDPYEYTYSCEHHLKGLRNYADDYVFRLSNGERIGVPMKVPGVCP